MDHVGVSTRIGHLVLSIHPKCSRVGPGALEVIQFQSKFFVTLLQGDSGCPAKTTDRSDSSYLNHR